jgi:phosphoglycerate dehydrogenase-like enzyme
VTGVAAAGPVQGPLVVTLKLDAAGRAVVEAAMAGLAPVVYLHDVPDGDRAVVLRTAGTVLARHTGQDLRPGEDELIGHARLLQFVTAGVDYIPLKQLPDTLPIAANGGAYAEPMAEHAVAMAFAAAKRLLVEHDKLTQGTFDQFKPNRMLAGGVCGIVGFGGIGAATARLMRALGLRIHALNRSGRTAEPVDWIGPVAQIDALLAASDVVILSLPLTPATHHMIGARELGLMKTDAILINLARGEIIDEAALYAHLLAKPAFTACIDAWWIEPVRHGRFETGYPFLTLPNVIASPHNSASVGGWRDVAFRRAAKNVARVYRGEPPSHLVLPQDRMQ